VSIDWLTICRSASAGLQKILAENPTTLERARETGSKGEGGDWTLVIDAAAEDVVFAELSRLFARGERFTAVSEERGRVDFGSEQLIVVIDPIDGSLNAKRGLPHASISIAVADGPTMGDVLFGYVHDFGPDEEWVAWRGRGATLNNRPISTEAGERRTPSGKLELVGLESAQTDWIRDGIDGLVDSVYRIRAIGTIAVSLCQVAAARFDGMLTLRNSRAVDTAAAQLILRESGGLVNFTKYQDPLSAPLDVEPRSPVVGARTAEGLAELSAALVRRNSQDPSIR
jgi:myo-inositol-1(or 4)-monophosphatase